MDAKFLTRLSCRMLKVFRETRQRVGSMLGIWTSGYQSGLLISCVSNCTLLHGSPVRPHPRVLQTNIVMLFFRSDVIKMFSPFGKITAEDFLWHTRGPKRGEPRGYAFVQYTTKEVRVVSISCVK